MKARFEFEKEAGEVRVEREQNTISVSRGKRITSFDLGSIPAGHRLLHKGIVFDATVQTKNGDEIQLTLNGKTVSIRWIDERRYAKQQGSHANGTGREIHAVMPGRVSKIYVKKGEAVASGQAVLVLEAMKMENEIKASSDGVISNIHVEAGASVEMGALLVTLDPLKK